MTIKVVHINSLPLRWWTLPACADHVYIGRKWQDVPSPDMVPDVDYPFGNPFVVGKQDADGKIITQAQAVELYAGFLLTILAENGAYRTAVASLAGKTLVCFCKSYHNGRTVIGHDRPCHGDVLADYSERLNKFLTLAEAGMSGVPDVLERERERLRSQQELELELFLKAEQARKELLFAQDASDVRRALIPIFQRDAQANPQRYTVTQRLKFKAAQ